AELDDIGAGLRQRPDDLERGCRVGIAGHDVGDKSRAAFLGELCKTRIDAGRHCFLAFRISPTCGTSLSPRPERLTTMRCSFGRSGASSMTFAIACAGSSAGMMPSSRDSS